MLLRPQNRPQPAADTTKTRRTLARIPNDEHFPCTDNAGWWLTSLTNATTSPSGPDPHPSNRNPLQRRLSLPHSVTRAPEPPLSNPETATCRPPLPADRAPPTDHWDGIHVPQQRTWAYFRGGSGRRRRRATHNQPSPTHSQNHPSRRGPRASSPPSTQTRA